MYPSLSLGYIWNTPSHSTCRVSNSSDDQRGQKLFPFRGGHRYPNMKLSGFIYLGAAGTALAQAPKYLPITPAKGTLLDAPPRLGLGTWYMRGNTSEAIASAIELGYRHIDCAKVYGNQRAVGVGIANGLKRANITRRDIWVTSKLWNSEYARLSQRTGRS
jgi:hypothetical protein